MLWLACLALLQVDYDALVERLGSDDVAVRGGSVEDAVRRRGRRASRG